MTAPDAGRPFGGAPVSTLSDPFTRKAAPAMTLTHTDPTDPWTESDDDDVPMLPDGNVRIGWRDTPHHYIEQTALVYLRLSDDGQRWIVDSSSLDGHPLDSAYDDISAHNSECPCGAPEECERARAAADQIPLPTGRELAALIVQAL